MEKDKFNSSTVLGEIFEFSGVEEVLAKHSVPCLGCPMAKMEAGDLTVGKICSMYGLDETGLLRDLNAAWKNYFPGGDKKIVSGRKKSS